MSVCVQDELTARPCSVESLEPFSHTVLELFRRNARDTRCAPGTSLLCHLTFDLSSESVCLPPE